MILNVENLKKSYNKEVEVLHSINFSIQEGEIVGIVGHNGAGKSTTLKCITGMIPFNDGIISLNGTTLKATPKAYKSSFGFVTDNHELFTKMTGIQYLNFLADIYRVSTEDRQNQYKLLEEYFNLGPAINDSISSYSHGMKQKLSIMGSLIHNPLLWILDEPLSGLDPHSVQALSDFMKLFSSKGHSILFSSHNIEAIQLLCNRIIIIHNGSLIDNFTIDEYNASNKNVLLRDYLLENTKK
ncbi:MAG: ABC transporter ATP-binding protein [Christensenella sp.]|nr:ABC transporter ATP-binding protein [Christensenella sp.]